ncbi:MAG: 3-oxoadipate enol-lactonase [Pseudomonadota bacterium]
MVEVVARDGTRLRVHDTGPANGPAVVLSGSLGTGMALWVPLLSFLPSGLRVVIYDMRGHGGSDVPPAPYSMDTLVNDAADICNELAIRDALFVGLSVGGMVAIGLALQRPDLVRALVLSNTATKLGTVQQWQQRIDTVRQGGLSSVSDEIMHRWFGKDFYGSPSMPLWLDMLMRTPVEGYIGVCNAIAGTNLYEDASKLRIPVLGLAGDQDGATPPDLVRETVDLIPGSQFQILRGVGHLPCVEAPEAYGLALTEFMADIGHFGKRSGSA